MALLINQSGFANPDVSGTNSIEKRFDRSMDASLPDVMDKPVEVSQNPLSDYDLGNNNSAEAPPSSGGLRAFFEPSYELPERGFDEVTRFLGPPVEEDLSGDEGLHPHDPLPPGEGSSGSDAGDPYPIGPGGVPIMPFNGVVLPPGLPKELKDGVVASSPQALDAFITSIKDSTGAQKYTVVEPGHSYVDREGHLFAVYESWPRGVGLFVYKFKPVTPEPVFVPPTARPRRDTSAPVESELGSNDLAHDPLPPADSSVTGIINGDAELTDDEALFDLMPNSNLEDAENKLKALGYSYLRTEPTGSTSGIKYYTNGTRIVEINTSEYSPGKALSFQVFNNDGTAYSNLSTVTKQLLNSGFTVERRTTDYIIFKAPDGHQVTLNLWPESMSGYNSARGARIVGSIIISQRPGLYPN